MNPLLESRLSQEDRNVRRLIWILQMKQGSLTDSRFRRWFNLKRDKQIIILKNKGFNYPNLVDKAKQYQCLWEMFK